MLTKKEIVFFATNINAVKEDVSKKVMVILLLSCKGKYKAILIIWLRLVLHIVCVLN
jgi:hypothetical protein